MISLCGFGRHAWIEWVAADARQRRCKRCDRHEEWTGVGKAAQWRRTESDGGQETGVVSGAAVPPVHPDDAAVDAFAAAMKLKLAQAREQGRGGWNRPSECSQFRLSQYLRNCVDKGDPVDVANFACFLWSRGESVMPDSLASRRPRAQQG